jgi:hypothetical protein
MKPLFMTSFLFLIPICGYMKNEIKTYHKNVLVIMLSFNFILSTLFWYDTKKNTLIHKIDAIFAKLTMGGFLLYVMTIKNNLMNYSLILQVLGIAYLSNTASRNKWYSRNHIMYHSLFHILCSTTTFMIFIQ